MASSFAWLISSKPRHETRSLNREKKIQAGHERGLTPTPNQEYFPHYPVPREGRWPSSRTLGRDAVDAAASARNRGRRAVFRERSTVRWTNDVAAYGKAVWSWHPLLVSSWRRFFGPDRARQTFNPLTTVTRRIRRRGEHDISRKTIACGNAG